MNRLLEWPHPILKGSLLNIGSGLPQRPQRCKFFADGQFTVLGRRLDGEVRILVSVDIGLQLK